MKRVLKGYGQVLKIVFKERPFIIYLCASLAVIGGIIAPVFTWVNGRIIDMGIEIAMGNGSFRSYIPYLILFSLCMLLPQVFTIVLSTYILPASRLILRTAYKGEMIQKLKKMRYEHLENAASFEIIEKAFGRAEEAALHLFPNYFYRLLFSLTSMVGLLYVFGTVRRWLLITILVPFILDIYLNTKNRFNIYEEMETYWNKEHSYTVLGNMLKSRNYIRENQLFQSSDYLVDTYTNRLNTRNREFERYYFYNLKKFFAARNLSKIAQLFNALLLLCIYLNGGLSVGQLIAMTTTVFVSLWSSVEQFGTAFKWGGYHLKTFEYYDRYFDLSENTYGSVDEIPEETSIEFSHVHFTYPGAEKEVLQDLSFTIEDGETVAIVGKNGEGKSTIVSLLLGLFIPDCGQICIGGRPLQDYSRSVQVNLFGSVFQNFNRYSGSVYENVGVGDVKHMDDIPHIQEAIKKAKADTFLDNLPAKGNTILGPDFEDGMDLSGGQWQRIAIARAFMGNKPILVLDEPTSQLDPKTESELYSDFVAVSKRKTTIMTTHRLGATKIADRIIVIANGGVSESGTHEELMAKGGLYAEMFNSQKQWYDLDLGGIIHGR